MSGIVKFVQGNEACVEAALYAGMDFFAGYPITPSTEIAELMAVRLPQKGGMFIQMEDEIASICAIIGASLTGRKVMTATSGPGFSLMQEGLGYAVMAEIPCVIVNVQPFAHVSKHLIEQQDHWCPVRLRKIEGIHRNGKDVLMARCCQRYDRMVSVCSPPRLVHITLAHLCRQPCGGSATLDIHNHAGDFCHDSVA